MTRRQVRVTAAFFDQLDSQFGPDRGPNGEPSSTDFMEMELPSIIERFAEHFLELPEAMTGVGGLRMMIAPGLLLHSFGVYGMLAEDGAIDLVGITFEA